MPPKSKPTSSHSSSRRSTSSHSSHHFTTNNLSYKPDRYSSGLTTGLLLGSMLNNGDYGWMEYDFDEDCWYIQTDDETWEKYIGSTDGLWHINETK